MRNGIHVLVVFGLALVVVVGCGGGASSPGAAGSQAAPATNGAGGASQAPAATSAASVAGVPSQAPAGGGTGGGVCALVTTDELAKIFGTAVTTTVIAGPPDTCKIDAAGTPIAAFVLSTTGAGPVYDGYANDPGATQISGIGDKAAYAPSMQLLVVLKGDKLLSMSAYDKSKTDEERLELMKKIAAVAVGRM